MQFDSKRFDSIGLNSTGLDLIALESIGFWGSTLIGLPVWGLATKRMVATKKIFHVYQKTCLGIRKTFTNSVFHLFGNLHFES